ncbi:chorismate mutase [Phyllobacterium sp. SB3]|uniref:chorismate mutase n=1 Tax=Phyllobacterium sp. SB3 TaxID=3156073 RepID=UPI0032AFD411
MKQLDVAQQLSSYRHTIDNLDAALIDILAKRFHCTNQIGVLKAEHNLSPVDKDREERQYARIRILANGAKLDQNFVENLMDFIISEVVQRHYQIAADYQARQAPASQG